MDRSSFTLIDQESIHEKESSSVQEDRKISHWVNILKEMPDCLKRQSHQHSQSPEIIKTVAEKIAEDFFNF